jgi:hypothetical protein
MYYANSLKAAGCAFGEKMNREHTLPYMRAVILICCFATLAAALCQGQITSDLKYVYEAHRTATF